MTVVISFFCVDEISKFLYGQIDRVDLSSPKLLEIVFLKFKRDDLVLAVYLVVELQLTLEIGDNYVIKMNFIV